MEHSEGGHSSDGYAYIYTYVPLCVGGSKRKAGIHLKYYPESRDTFEMYPGKVMHMIGHCHSHSLGFLYKVLPEYSR